MTELSKFWTHGAGGDASASPYDVNEFGPSFLDRIFPSSGKGVVIPLYGNNLDVVASSPAAASVKVRSGAAFFSGFFYESDADTTLTVASNSSGFSRIDRVVIRINWSARTIRLAIIEGDTGDNPELPELTQVIGDIWEESIAYVWVENGFTSIANEDIHDEREFRATAALFKSHHTTQNLLYNPEFLAWSGYNNGSITTTGATTASRVFRAAIRYKPDYWYEVGSMKRSYLTDDQQVFHPGWSKEEHPAEFVSRGNAVNFTTDSDLSGIRQKVIVREGLVYSLKVLVFVPDGSEAVIGYTQNGTSRESGYKYIKRTGEWVAETIRITAESGATAFQIYILARRADTSVKVVQAILVPNYIPGEFREHRQFIPFDTYVGTERGYKHDRIVYNSTLTDITERSKDRSDQRSTYGTFSATTALDPGVDRIISGVAPAATIIIKQMNGASYYEEGQTNKLADGIRNAWFAGDVSNNLQGVLGLRNTSILFSGESGKEVKFGATTNLSVTGRMNTWHDFHMPLFLDPSIGYEPAFSTTFNVGPNASYPHTASQFFSIRPIAIET